MLAACLLLSSSSFFFIISWTMPSIVAQFSFDLCIVAIMLSGFRCVPVIVSARRLLECHASHAKIVCFALSTGSPQNQHSELPNFPNLFKSDAKHPCPLSAEMKVCLTVLSVYPWGDFWDDRVGLSALCARVPPSLPCYHCVFVYCRGAYVSPEVMQLFSVLGQQT